MNNLTEEQIEEYYEKSYTLNTEEQNCINKFKQENKINENNTIYDDTIKFADIANKHGDQVINYCEEGEIFENLDAYEHAKFTFTEIESEPTELLTYLRNTKINEKLTNFIETAILCGEHAAWEEIKTNVIAREG